MSVDIGQVIEEGGRRTLARNGLYLVVITWVLGVLNALFGNTVTQEMIQQVPAGPNSMPIGPGQMGPSLGIPAGIAGLLSLLVTLLTVVVAAAAIRTFVTADTETLPGDRFTRNLGWMLLNLVIGWIVFSIVVGIGLVLLIIPGLFLLVSLFFWTFYVVLDDENFVEGFQNSWALTGGNRLVLFVLGVLVAIISIVVGGIFGIPQAFLPGIVGVAIAQIGSAFASVFALATAARTFLQLTVEEPGEVTE